MQGVSNYSALSFPRAFWAVIRRPIAAFTNLVDYPSRSWLILAILLMGLVLLSGALNQNLQLSRQTEPISNGLPSMILSVGKSLLLWLKWLIWAGLLYLVSTLFGGNSTFRTLWRVVIWTSVPDLIRSLLQVVSLWLTRQPIEYAGLSGLILRSAENPAGIQLALAGLLAQIDLFVIWRLALLTIGLTCATSLAQRKSWTVVLIIWALLIALGLIPAQLFNWVDTSIS
jgi:hypothetical protein